MRELFLRFVIRFSTFVIDSILRGFVLRISQPDGPPVRVPTIAPLTVTLRTEGPSGLRRFQTTQARFVPMHNRRRALRLSYKINLGSYALNRRRRRPSRAAPPRASSGNAIGSGTDCAEEEPALSPPTCARWCATSSTAFCPGCRCNRHSEVIEILCVSRHHVVAGIDHQRIEFNRLPRIGCVVAKRPKLQR